MKIKTIIRNFDWVEEFDKEVNEAQEEGWRLVKREVLPGTPGDPGSRRLLYAELVQLDPEPEPEDQPLDPIVCLESLRKFCTGSMCDTCPLDDFCARHLPRNEGPADWELPGEGAPEA